MKRREAEAVADAVAALGRTLMELDQQSARLGELAGRVRQATEALKAALGAG